MTLLLWNDNIVLNKLPFRWVSSMLGEILYLSFIVHASETEGKAPLLHLKLPYQKKTKQNKKNFGILYPKIGSYIFKHLWMEEEVWGGSYENICQSIYVCVCSVMSNSLWPYGL